MTASEPPTPDSAMEVLRHHGKSFHFAGFFLSREDARNSARLYRFCRYVDDLADEPGDERAASEKLLCILRELEQGESADPVVRDFLILAREREIDRETAAELCRGALQDLHPVRIADETELLRYCYKVAGTVGLMMCRLLGAAAPQARAHALDLGIAMQLTNIARDVSEDAQRGRLYLPGEGLDDLPLSLIARGAPEARNHLRGAVRRILALADRYYRSGEDGLRYLPARPRLAIRIASRVYREIGTEIAARDYASWEGRAIVPTRRKVRLGLKAVLDQCFLRRTRQEGAPHNHALHLPLQGLPGTHSHPA